MNFKPTLKTYLFLWFVIIAILPLMLYALLEIRKWQGIQERETRTQLMSLTIALEQIQIGKVESRIHAVEAIAKQLGTLSLNQTGKIQSLLDLYRPQFNMGFLYVGALNGKSIAADVAEKKPGQVITGVDYSDRDYYKAVMSERKTVISQVQVGKVTGRVNLQVATPIFNSQKEMTGFVTASLEISELEKVIEKVLPRDSIIRIVVLDRAGKLVVQKNGQYISPLTVLGGLPFFSPPKDIMGFRKGVDELGHSVFGLVRKVDPGRLDWTFIVSVPSEALKAEAQKARSSVIFYISILLIFALLAARLFANFISARFSQVISYVQKVGRGDFKAEKPQLGRLQIEELKTLVQTVQSMSDSLQDHMRKLEKASRMKSQFLANMSHEIRTPIYGMMGMNELLLRTSLSSEQRDYAKTALESTESLLRLIDDILDLSRIEAGKLSFEYREIELLPVIRGVIKLLKPLAERKEIAINLEIDPRLPEVVITDSERLSQILMNLLGNAIKFTIDGSVSVSALLIEQDSDVSRVRFEIKDTGIGMSEETISKLFQPFSQADLSTTRKYGGSGLGLSICKELVSLMKGQIGVESELGKGSLFWFELEFQSAPKKSTVSALSSSHPPPIKAKPLLKRRLLVAEDNLVNQKIIGAHLKKLGYDFQIVSNGAEALEAVSRADFQLILMDCQMPEMDGYQATAEIREREKNLGRKNIIIALTANALEEDRKKCIAFGMDDYISKPVLLDRLKEVLESWLKTPSA